MIPQKLREGTPIFCSLSDVVAQLYNESLTRKDETAGLARLLPSETFLDVSLFQVYLDDEKKPVTSYQGPFGQVWKARMGNKTVALKTVYFNVYTARLFSREMTALRSLESHQCVLELHGLIYTGLDILLVLEYAPGPSLMDAIQSLEKSRQISWGERPGQAGLSLATKIASGLCHLHKCNAVISELNPILTEDMKNAKVVGFNLNHIGRTPPFSKIHGSPPFSRTHAIPGHIPRPCKDWIAPEVLANRRFSAKADVFSFGAILFEMVVREYVDVHMQGVKPEVPQQCSQEVSDLIEACLNVDPNDRPDSKDIFKVLSSLVPVA